MRQRPAGAAIFQVGDVIEQRYRVFAVKQGGMGIVLLCEDLAWRKGGQPLRVALKTLLPQLQNMRGVAERFLNEARLWVDLGNHRNILRAWYVKRIENMPFICLEFIEGPAGLGPDLDSWIQAGRLTVSDSLDFALQFCAGMMYAAESFAARGLRFLHRDIKPGNTMIDRRLQVKITDFGLAKAFDQPRAETPIAPAAGLTSSGGAQLTVAGTVLGTPRYMSPEQCRAIVNLDARSDIYSFGCMFFEMLTGEPVFRAATMKEMLTKQCREAPPRPTDLTPHLPTDLDCVVLRCLEKDPARRYADFAELREDLAAAQLAIVGKRAPDAVTSKTPPPSALGEKLNRSMSLFELGERKEGARLFAEAIGARSGGAADTSAAPRRLVKGGVAGAPPAGEKQKEED